MSAGLIAAFAECAGAFTAGAALAVRVDRRRRPQRLGEPIREGMPPGRVRGSADAGRGVPQARTDEAEVGA